MNSRELNLISGWSATMNEARGGVGHALDRLAMTLAHLVELSEVNRETGSERVNADVRQLG